ncbi:MAG TPA: DUF3667 domain-containing protein, partial [Allosphingosinicella sp.]|nr:DUF3667 domain-containing protein [Allosphingosinicella sp.]
ARELACANGLDARNGLRHDRWSRGVRMVEGLDGVGERVRGGLVAHAVEPEAGEHRHAAGDSRACLNCGTPVTANFCPQCGQKALVHRTLKAFWHDIAHSVLHFEGKIWRTLPLLAWKPGELTRRYVEGERARFVSPMALFLFSVFLMFALVSALGGSIYTPDEGTPEQREEVRREFEQEQAESVAKLDRLRQDRARLAAAGEPTVEADRKISNAKHALALKEQLFRETLPAEAGEEEAQVEPQPVPGPAKKAAQQADEENLVIISGADGLNRWFNSAYQKAKKNPSLLIYKIQANAYKFSWALIPISVPFVCLLFLHRRRYRQYKVYDHTVFVTYSIAFMSLAAIAFTLLRQIGLDEGLAMLALILVPPLHMYRQLRGAYRLSRWSAAWRTGALLVFAAIASSIFFMLLLALGVLG